MSHEKLEQEIDQLSEQLKTLRLPHKLNQYRSYEKRLLLLRKLSANVPDKSFQIDQLQIQLDNSVLCGVNQCFLCASNQNAVPNKVPLYSRSVSAGMVHRSRYSSNENRVSAQLPKFGQQISYHHQLTKKDEPLLKEAPPTPPASSHSEDSSDQCESIASTVHIEPIINDKSETGSDYETNSPVYTSTSDSNPKDSNQSQSYMDHVETNTPVFTSASDIKDNDKSEHILEDKKTAEVDQNGEQSHSNAKADTHTVLTSSADSIAEEPRTSVSFINKKVMTKSNMVAGPLPFRTTTSYRTYKDFVNNYSATDRNKKSQVPDKRAA